MKKLFLFLSFLLAGCSANVNQQLNFAPQAPAVDTPALSSVEASVSTQDLRHAQYVALLSINDDKSIPIHPQQNVRTTLSSQLNTLFKDSGINIQPHANNQIKIDIVELLVEVEQTSFQSTLNARMLLKLTATNAQGAYNKLYNSRVNQKHSFGTTNEDIEKVLNRVTSIALQEMAQDTELFKYIKENF